MWRQFISSHVYDSCYNIMYNYRQICMLDKDVNKIFFRQSVQYNALHGISPWGWGRADEGRRDRRHSTIWWGLVWKTFWKFSKLKYLCLQLSKFQKWTYWRAKMVNSVLTSSGVNRSCLWYYNDLGKIFRFACCFRMYSIKKKNK